MAADDDTGLLAAYARFVVRRSCLSFWLSLLGTSLLIMFGMMITIADARSKGQSGILSEQTEYDWTVTGAKLMKHKDMVDDALDRRDSYSEVSAIAEREDEFEHRYSFNFLYYWEDGREADIWTAENLQTMCEVENIVYSTPGYERFCLNASTVPSLSALGHLSTHAMHTSSNATSGATCSLPPMSAVSVFYQDFDPAAATPSVQPLFELFYGSHLGEAPHAAAPLVEGDWSSGGDELRGGGFVAAGTHERDCVLLDADYVAARRARLYAIAQTSPALLASVGFFLSRDALADASQPMTTATRSLLSFGSPLRNFTDELDRKEEQEELLESFILDAEQRLFDYFGMKAGLFYSPYRDKATAGALKVTFVNFFLYSPTEFGRLAGEDFQMVVLSIIFVGAYIGFHTRSLALALFGLAQILLSLPLALFFYGLFRLTWFSQVHILSVFVVLGVGADDIFVFFDAWRQSATLPPPISSSVTSRLTFTLRRSTAAIFNTSFTTAIAFFATGVSPIMPLAAFGTYAALAIVMNYVLIVFWWPSVMMVWEIHLRGARCCGCCISCDFCPCAEATPGEEQSCLSAPFWTTKLPPCQLPLTTALPPQGAAAAAATATATAVRAAEVNPTGVVPPTAGGFATEPDGESAAGVVGGPKGSAETASPVKRRASHSRTSVIGDPDKLSKVEKFFKNVYAKQLTRRIGGGGDGLPPTPSSSGSGSAARRVKPVSLALVVLFGGIGVALLSQAAQMTPPTKEETWFPSGHMLRHATEEPRENFLATDDAGYTFGWLYFGLSDLDAPDFDRFDPSKNRGDVILDEAFDLGDAAAQRKFVEYCAALEAAACGLEACTRPPHTLTYEVRCVVRAFALAQYGAVEALPTGAAFAAALRDWLLTSAGAAYQEDVGYIDGALRFASIHFKMTMPTLQPSYKVRPVYELFTDLIDAQQASATATAALGTVFVYAGREFVWMGTQEALVRGVFVGFAICFPVAFLVLIVATGSVRVSTFAIATICLVVGSLLGFVSTFLDWDLGTGEAIAATIVIGLSVDYTVHLGHMYVEAAPASREGKLEVSATNMGGTVVSGGVTTLGAASFMYFCQLTFFSKMATLITGTIFFSLLYSLLFFMPLLAVLGPEGEMLTVRERVARWRGAILGGGASSSSSSISSTTETRAA